MVQFGQGFASINPPMKELQRLVLCKKLHHGNNPVLTGLIRALQTKGVAIENISAIIGII